MTLTETKQHSSGGRYKPIHLDTVFVGMDINFDLYIKYEHSQRYTLYRHKGHLFTEADKLRVVTNEAALFIRFGEFEHYNKYVENKLNDVLADATLDVETKGKFLYTATINYVNEIFEIPNNISDLSRSKALVHNILTCISGAKEIQDLMNPLVQHCFYTYTHSAQTTTLALVLARHAFKDAVEDFFIEVGTGGLLHDIGKIHISKDILNKPGTLTPEEFEVMKHHTEYGLEILKRQNINSSIVINMVKQHHEKMDGTGYPSRLSADEISKVGKLTAVADVYAALVSDRPYRPRMEHDVAIHIMEHEMKGSFDEETLGLLKDIIIHGIH